MQFFLLDQRGELGIANIARLGQVAMQIVVMQDRQWDDFAGFVNVIAIPSGVMRPSSAPIVWMSTV